MRKCRSAVMAVLASFILLGTIMDLPNNALAVRIGDAFFYTTENWITIGTYAFKFKAACWTTYVEYDVWGSSETDIADNEYLLVEVFVANIGLEPVSVPRLCLMDERGAKYNEDNVGDNMFYHAIGALRKGEELNPERSSHGLLVFDVSREHSYWLVAPNKEHFASDYAAIGVWNKSGFFWDSEAVLDLEQRLAEEKAATVMQPVAEDENTQDKEQNKTDEFYARIQKAHWKSLPKDYKKAWFNEWTRAEKNLRPGLRVYYGQGMKKVFHLAVISVGCDDVRCMWHNGRKVTKSKRMFRAWPYYVLKADLKKLSAATQSTIAVSSPK
ncbi:DUF4352 domain-containing protein [bacterium]|nr:DUF4352 domain-containing protein [bacterium]